MSDRAVPNLPSRDFDATAGFYSRFGFVVTYRDDGWLILDRGGVTLEFFTHADVDPLTSSAMCSIRVADVDALYADIRSVGVAEKTTGYPRLHPVVRQGWGGRVGALIDPDGTQLNLIEDPPAG